MIKKFLSTLSIYLIATFLLSGCNYPLYKVDVQQGNILEAKQLSRLKLGMTKLQVKSLLGSSMLSEESSDHWIYLYYCQPGYGSPTHKRVDLTFTEGALSRFKIQ